MNLNREAELFSRALSVPAAQRAAWIQMECGEDVALRQRLEALLAANDLTDSFMAETTEQTRPLSEGDLPEFPEARVPFHAKSEVSRLARQSFRRLILASA
jgi:hypothetical protein